MHQCPGFPRHQKQPLWSHSRQEGQFKDLDLMSGVLAEEQKEEALQEGCKTNNE
jgi:hypothetical protein